MAPGDDVGVGVHREHDDGDAGRALGDEPGRLDAVEHGHGDVHQHHVGLQLLGQAGRLVAVARLADHLEALVLHGAAQALAQHGVVVGQQQPDGWRQRHSELTSFSRQRTVVPVPGAESISSEAPMTAARSRIPRMPYESGRPAPVATRPCPSSCDLERARSGRRSPTTRARCVGPGVSLDVGDGLLGDAPQLALDAERQPGRRVVDELDLEAAALLHPVQVGVERADQVLALGHVGAQVVERLPHLADDLRAPRPAASRGRRRRTLAGRGW